MTSQELSKLKPGDTVYLGQLPVKFKSIKNTVILHFEPCETSGLLKGFEHVSQFSIRPMLHQTKYDPCRLFRKGDKVQVKKRDGRCNGKDGEYLREAFCTVAEDEIQNELVRVFHNATEYRLGPAYLELVTPVEELEPYTVGKSELNTEHGDYDTWAVYDEHGYIVAQFAEEAYKLGEAKARANQECARLNAEHRKEHE